MRCREKASPVAAPVGSKDAREPSSPKVQHVPGPVTGSGEAGSRLIQTRFPAAEKQLGETMSPAPGGEICLNLNLYFDLLPSNEAVANSKRMCVLMY